MRDPRRAGALLLLAAALVVYLGHAASFGSCLQDDAYVSLRYARSLAGGHGLVYNPGERVEGYTNFLWTLFAAVPFLVGIDPAGFLVGMGLVSGVGALLAAWFLTRRLAPEKPFAAAAAAMVVAGLPFLVAESVMGLETVAFAALVALATALYLGEARGSSFPWSGGALGIAALTRPEGVLVGAVLFLFDFVVALRERRIGRARLLRWLLFAVPVAGHLAFRLAYYGDVVPNTFHAKVGGGTALAARGLAYAGDFVLRAWPLLAAAVVGAVVFLHDRARRTALVAIAVPIVYMVYVIAIGGDYKGTLRFFAAPALVLAAWAGIGIDRLGRARVAALGIVVALVLVLGGPTREFARARVSDLPLDREIGRWLKENLPPSAVLATSNAGIVPFESGLVTIDMLGLCDRRIARSPVSEMGRGEAGHEKADTAYVLERRPDVVLFGRSRVSRRPVAPERIASVLMWRAEKELWADPTFQRDYALRTVPLGSLYLNYYARTARP